MSLYAEGTKVAESKSKVEIDEMLRKWKASSVAIGEDSGAGVVIFVVAGWHVRFRCPLPTPAQAAERKDGHGYRLGATKQGVWLEEERRRRWRALGFTIKAKLVSVENGIEKFEEAFLAHIVVEGGMTVGQKALPALAEVYKSGKMPNGGLLGAGT